MSSQVWNIFNDGRFYKLYGLPLPMFDNSHRKSFIMFKLDVLCFHVYPFPLNLLLSTTEKNLALLFLLLSIRFLYALLRSLQAFSFLKLNNSSSLRLSSHVRCFKALIVLVAYHWSCSSMPMSFLYWGTYIMTEYSRYDHFNLYYFDHWA